MYKNEKCSVIIVAGGKGSRFGESLPKQFITVDGKCILNYTIEKFEKNNFVDEIIIVTLKEYVNFVKEEVLGNGCYKKVSCVVEGGAERQDSVYSGLKSLDENAHIVLIHDGVRPFVENEDISNIIAETYINKSCVLGVKVIDTVKVADADGFVVKTPPREFLWQIQTPQGFIKNLIIAAYENAMEKGLTVTDDAMMMEALGIRTKIVTGNYSNIKITNKDDLKYFKFR